MTDKPSPHALMLRDTVIWLKEHLEEVTGNTDFDQGYRMGLAFAVDTLKQECNSFGLRDDLGWMEPDVNKWLGSDRD